MLEKSKELLLALVAIVVITLAYLIVQMVYRQTPPASSLFGHSLGILGFLLMLMTETLYSLRKRSQKARWGKMSQWLEFHIFTGIVGPYMVLLHTSWKFNGIAGLLTLMTLAIVTSGFIGRYIYTAIPRTVNGNELSLEEIEEQLRAIDREAAIQSRRVVGRREPAVVSAFTAGTGARIRAAPVAAESTLREGEKRLKELRQKRDRLRRQAASIATARRILAIWHAVHIPLGLTLFLTAFVHIAAAVYYAMLLH